MFVDSLQSNKNENVLLNTFNQKIDNLEKAFRSASIRPRPKPRKPKYVTKEKRLANKIGDIVFKPTIRKIYPLVPYPS